MSYRNYSNSADLIAKIAHKYFSNQPENKNHAKFYETIISFSGKQIKGSHDQDGERKYHKETIATALIKNEVNFLPDVVEPWKCVNIFYKEESNQLKLPNFFDVKITIHKIGDSIIENTLNIKYIGTTTELLKLYKQCSFDENINEETSGKNLTEEKQVKLIKSLFDLVKNELDGSDKKSTHRFAHLFERKIDKSEAYFNISTIFLKTTQGNYKPAQLCKLDDINKEEFGELLGLESKNEDGIIDNFLTFVGVSDNSKFIYTDKNIYKRYKNGIDAQSLPVVIGKSPLLIDDIMKNIVIVNGDKQVHPATITENENYASFLNHVKFSKKRKPSDLLKKYDSTFPEIYRKILREHFWGKISEVGISIKEEKCKRMIRFYQINYKNIFSDTRKLILKNGLVSYTDDQKYISLNKEEFVDLCIENYNGNIAILCHFDNDSKTTIDLKESSEGEEISFQDFLNQNENLDYNKFHNRFIHLLVEISKSDISSLDFLSDDNQDTSDTKKTDRKTLINSIKEKLQSLSVIKHDFLKILCEISSVENGNFFIERPCFLNNNKLHISIDKYKKGDLAEGLADYFFNKKSLRDKVDLIIFRKDEREFSESDDYRKTKDYLVSKPEDDSDKDDDFPITPNDGKTNPPIQPRVTEITGNDQPKSVSIVNDKNPKEKTIEETINDIHKNFSELTSSSIQIRACEAQNPTLTRTQPTDRKTNRATNRDSINEKEQRNKETGNESEQQALNYFIKEFIGTFDIENNKVFYTNGIESVWTLIDKKLNKSERNEYIKYKNQCMKVIENQSSKKEDFEKSLIPLFYFTLHYPFASFDLVVYDRKAEQAKLIEVKGSKDEIMSKFHLSDNEINEAIGEIPYEIVIIEGINKDPRSIGNPIKIIKHHLQKIETDQFELTPKGYEFIFKN